VRFNSKARLDTSRVGDAGGGGGLGGGGLGSGGIGLPHVAGGGIGGLVLAVVVYFIIQALGGGSSTGGLGGSLGPLTTSQFSGTGLSGQAFDYSTCKTGADANNSSECAMVAIENTLTDYWSKQPQVKGVFKPETSIVVFHGSVQTDGCGSATTDVGPFYCPNPQTHQGSIYIDTAFYDTIFKQLGGDATPFTRAYVIAHEYGHHIQDLLGTMGRVRTQQGPNSDSVRLELQADCYAGMWAAAAPKITDANGEPIISDITDQDIHEAITAAHDVGDDYIQTTMSGRTNPEQWTHGSSAEREAWFQQGMNAGDDIKNCDTFASQNLQQPGS
jgi:predicted metalloprotease